MKKLKERVFAAMFALFILMIGSGCLYAMANQLDKAALARSVESFPDHSEITAQTLKH